MSIKSLIFGILAVLILSEGCSTVKKTSEKEGKKSLTEAARYKESDLFTKAVTLKETGKLTEAEETMQKALAINPDDPAANYEEAKILLRLGRKDEALVYAQKAAHIDENNPWYKKLYGDLLKANGNYKEYLNVYEDLVKQYPHNYNFLNELAFAYYFTGNYKKAVEYYKKVQEIEGFNERLSKQIAELYARIGQPEKGAEVIQKLINTFPDEKRYYALLAEYCVNNKMYDKAENAYKKILEIDPQDPYVHISLSDFYRKKGDPDKSFEELKAGFANPKLSLKTKINLLMNFYSGNLSDKQKEQALELSEILKKTHPGEDLSEAFYATMLYENKKYEEAEKLTRKILKTNKVNYALWEQLLFCDLYLSLNDTLVQDADSAIEIFPNQPIPYLLSGIAWFQLKKYKKAKKMLETGKDLVVNNNALLEQFYTSLGDTYNELKLYQKSYDAYEHVLQLNPDNSLVLNNYAYYLSLRGEQLDKAQRMAEKAVSLDPYNQNNLDTYAWVLYKKGNYKDALEWEKKALNNGGDTSGVVLEHLGDIYYRLGKKEEALKWWIKAKDKKDHSEQLDKKIKDKKLYEE